MHNLDNIPDMKFIAYCKLIGKLKIHRFKIPNYV